VFRSVGAGSPDFQKRVGGSGSLTKRCVYGLCPEP